MRSRFVVDDDGPWLITSISGCNFCTRAEIPGHEPSAATSSAPIAIILGRAARILALADDTTVTVIALHTGEVLSTHHIDPTRSYWRNNEKAPGRWPRASSSET